MRIVQVMHGFPPYNMAGSEVYTYNLSKELSKTDEVFVFHRIADPEREEYEVSSGTYDGLNICRINNTFKYCDSFEKTYRNNLIAEKFGSFLDEVNPDIAHFGHVSDLSTSLIKEAKKRNIPVIFTLHDFWLFCQLGQLLKRDLSLCDGPEDSECARCLAPQLAVSGVVKRTFEGLKKTIPSLDNGSLLARMIRQLHLQYSKAFFRFQNHAKAQIQQRTIHVKEMCSLVDLFIAPSKFLLHKFVQFGIPKEKIVFHEYGFNTALFDSHNHVRSANTRFGYIGTFIPSKGVHVLLEAFNSLKSDDAELRIHGKFLPYHPGFENYPDYLQSLGKNDYIKWFGEYENKDIAAILSEIDVLVVPSIWYENSPLTINESFMAQVPVITSNIGGMAELVRDHVNGLQFKVGDSEDLAKKMQMVVDNPALIDRLSNNIEPVISIHVQAANIREIYLDLMAKEKISGA